MWDNVRHGPHRGRAWRSAIGKIPELREEFWESVERARARTRT